MRNEGLKRQNERLKRNHVSTNPFSSKENFEDRINPDNWMTGIPLSHLGGKSRYDCRIKLNKTEDFSYYVKVDRSNVVENEESETVDVYMPPEKESYEVVSVDSTRSHRFLNYKQIPKRKVCEETMNREDILALAPLNTVEYLEEANRKDTMNRENPENWVSGISPALVKHIPSRNVNAVFFKDSTGAKCFVEVNSKNIESEKELKVEDSFFLSLTHIYPLSYKVYLSPEKENPVVVRCALESERDVDGAYTKEAFDKLPAGSRLIRDDKYAMLRMDRTEIMANIKNTSEELAVYKEKFKEKYNKKVSEADKEGRFGEDTKLHLVNIALTEAVDEEFHFEL